MKENREEDQVKIDALTTAFFDVFTNTNNRIPNIEVIKELFVDRGIIISNTDEEPIIYNLDEFIAPRQKILNDGTLTDFCESELSSKTEIYGHIAHRFCHYQKSGQLNGSSFQTEGMKTIQFVRIHGIWKISSVAWCDKGEA